MEIPRPHLLICHILYSKSLQVTRKTDIMMFI